VVHGIEPVDRRPVVVCALPMKGRALSRLASKLGDVRVVDVRETVEDATVVLAPSCSPQTLRALRRAYPGARLIVVELEDWDHDIELGGPVTRLRKAGADAYLAADSLEDLARQLTAPPRVDRPLLQKRPAAELRGAPFDDLIMTFLNERLEQSQPEPRQGS
jgi:hypothetical protein